MPDEYWKIDRYARLLAVCSKSGAQWDQYDEANDVMTLMLSDVHQLVISQGVTILESHSLLSARAWMRGVSRNDSLLFVCKVQISGKTETRKFRVRFCSVDGVSGEEWCKSCVERLREFLPVKLSVVKNAGVNALGQNQQESNNSSTEASKRSGLEGEVTLGDVAQALLTKESLPIAYLHHHASPESLQLMLRVCLADPAFPAFVEAVEKELKTITSNQ